MIQDVTCDARRRSDSPWVPDTEHELEQRRSSGGLETSGSRQETLAEQVLEVFLVDAHQAVDAALALRSGISKEIPLWALRIQFTPTLIAEDAGQTTHPPRRDVIRFPRPG